MAVDVAFLKCKMCGGTLDVSKGSSVAVCEYCETKQTIPKLNDEKRLQLFDRANHFRRANEFDKAMGIYEMVLSDDESDAEAYWGIVLCRYGITYVEDPVSHKRLPTVNRAQYVSIFEDADYKSAIKCADDEQRSVFESEARAIDNIQKQYLEISKDEDPFDVFICYKETGEDGQRTEDSVFAYKIYDSLTKEGFKVFFARVTLEDKLGEAYEPYIFAALNSAKVMIVVGTKREHFDAVWVKNEWSRYFGLMKESNGKDRTIIPVYKDISPYDLPEEFVHLQSQDFGKIGADQDIVRGVKKLVDKNVPAKPTPNTVINGVNIDAVLKRAFIFVEDKKWANAKAYLEKVLDVDPENARAYLALLMIELKVPRQEQLANCEKPFDNLPAYTKAYRYADRELRNLLQSYIKAIKERVRLKECEEIYKQAMHHETGQFNDIEGECSNLQKAAAKYKTIPGYKDADQRLEELEKRIRKLLEKLDVKKKRKKKLIKILAVVACVIFVSVVIFNKVIVPANNYKTAEECLERKDYASAAALFEELGTYKDSEERVVECKYTYGEERFQKQDYEGAYEAFSTIKDYKDATAKWSESGYLYAKKLLAAKDYENARTVLTALGTYKDCVDKKLQCLSDGTMYFYEQKDYRKVIDWYVECYDFNANADFYIESCYHYGVSLLESGQYESAIDFLKKAGGYSDAYSKINLAKYNYVNNNRDRKNNLTYEYLKDLVSAGYENSGTIYNELYGWKVDVIAINTSAKDETTQRESISVYDPVYFHFVVSGGAPGEKVTISQVATYPDGSTTDTETKEYYDGYVGYYGWASGIYTIPTYGERGPLKMQFYANGEVIGEATVNMGT